VGWLAHSDSEPFNYAWYNFSVRLQLWPPYSFSSSNASVKVVDSAAWPKRWH